MRAGLRSGPFLDSLAKRPAGDIDELRRRESKYISIEEVRQSKRVKKTEKNDKKVNAGSGRKLASRIEVLLKLYELRGPKYAVYTLLNTTRAQILDEVYHAGFVEYPPWSSVPELADRRKYCRFHHTYGHTTEDCIEWKDQIEKLVQMGQLGEYVQLGRARRPVPWGDYGVRGRGRGRAAGGIGKVFRRIRRSQRRKETMKYLEMMKIIKFRGS